MNSLSKPKVVFFQINNISQKLIQIIRVAHFHFLKKEALLIKVPNPKASKYVEELLWKEPRESFLPHFVKEESTNELIVITQKEANVNNAHFLFNLCPMPFLPRNTFKVTYEFEEADKSKVFEKKFKIYRAKGFLIESNQG